MRLETHNIFFWGEMHGPKRSAELLRLVKASWGCVVPPSFSGPQEAELWVSQRTKTPQSPWANMFQSQSVCGIFLMFERPTSSSSDTWGKCILDIKSQKFSLWQTQKCLFFPLVHCGVFREEPAVLWRYQRDCLFVTVHKATEQLVKMWVRHFSLLN